MTKSSRPFFAITFALLLVSSVVVAPLATATPTPESETATATESAPTTTTSATPTPTSAVEPIDGTLPRDNDGDGRYEDLNANGEMDLADAVTYFQHRSDPVITDHVEAYDYNANGRIELADIVAHYQDEIVPADPVTDTDGDGLSDSREAELGTNASRNDSDGDGISDWVETDGGEPVDTDGDGTIDALDADSDGDGVLDAREGTADADGDGVPNYRDPDDDGDGIDTAVEVRDGRNASHDLDRDGTVNWLDTDSDGDGTPDGEEGRSDADGDGVPAYLDNDRDNDGLPDVYERNVTGTDPANNDSSSTHTSANEAGNGLLDGAEDFDDDGLTNVVEYRAGTDPFDADTDDDGLEDGYEHRQSWANATVADTDDDGVLDGAADEDDDGLTNAEEVDRGTVATLNDTDGDGLDDGAEVDNGTDPLLAHSDDDGLDDATELRLGTDPLANDTDGDGIWDGNATYQTNTTDAETGASVEVTGQGDAASGVTITNASSMGDADVGPVVHLQNETAFDEATVTLPVDETLATEEPSNVTLYKWSGSGEDAWRPLETRVNETTGIASATVESFSYVRAGLASEPSPDVVVEPVAPVDFDGTDGYDCTGDCSRSGADLTLSLSNDTVESPAAASNLGPIRPVGWNGSVDLSPLVPNDVDHVVAKNDSGNFTTIQSAVNAAESGETILVRNGTYREQVVVNTSVSLIGQHATLNGSNLDREATAFDMEESATISGFRIDGYSTGVRDDGPGAEVNLSFLRVSNTGRAVSSQNSTNGMNISSVYIVQVGTAIHTHNASGNWSISKVHVGGFRFGIDTQDSTGNWSIERLHLDSRGERGTGLSDSTSAMNWYVSNSFISGDSGIDGTRSPSDWHIRNSRIEADQPVEARNSTGDWYVSRIHTQSFGDSIEADESSGDWNVSQSTVSTDGMAINAHDSVGDWTVESVHVYDSSQGIGARGSQGNWTVDTIHINSSNSGINMGDLPGDWQIGNATITASNSGIEGQANSSTLTISNVFIKNNIKSDFDSSAMWIGGSSGEISIDNTSVISHDYSIRSAILLTGEDTNISLSNAEITNSQDGVDWNVDSGSLEIGETKFENVTDTAITVNVLNNDSHYSVHNSTLQSTKFGIKAEDGNAVVNASSNWWGQASGPTENQTLGPVNASNPCSSPCAGETAGWESKSNIRDAIGDLKAGPGSSASWEHPLGPANRSQIVLNYTAESTGENSWATVTAATTNETQHWRVPIDDATTPVRERLNVTNVQGDATITMRAVNTSVDVESVRVRRDDDGDGLWNHVERQTLRPRAGPVENVSTHPGDPDTDDDGVPDGEEIEVVPASESSIDAPPGSLVLDRVYSHPERADTDGDGLTDGQERHGWEIGVAPSPNASEAFLNRPDARTEADVYAVMYRLLYSDLQVNQTSFEENISFGGGLEAETPRDLLSLIAARSELDVDQLRADHLGEQRPRQPGALVTRTVRSDPLVPDTDGDGLSDEAEHYSGTDPGVEDTDGDGVDDAAELEDDQAPTLFDHRSPRVEVHSISSERGDLQIDDASGQTYVRFDYDVTLRATDQSGVRELRFRRGCRPAGEDLTDPTTECPVRTVETYDGSTRTAVREVEFSVNRSLQRELQTFAFAGRPLLESVNVTGEDVHGTSGSDDYVTPGAVPEFVERASEESLTEHYAEDVAKRHAVGSAAEQIGSIWGVRQGVADIKELLNNWEMVVTWVYYLDKLPQAITQAPEAIDGLQDRHNPYDRDDQYYDTYRTHWIGGYAQGIVAFEVATSKGAGSVKKAATVQSFRGADAAETVGDARNAAKLAGETVGRADVNPAPTRRALTEVSVQKRPELADSLARQDWATIRAALPEDTDAPAEVLVGRAIARTGADGEDLLGHLAAQGDEAAMRAFLASEDAGAQRRFAEAYGSGDVDASQLSEALRRYEDFDGSDEAAANDLIAATGDDAIDFLANADGQTVRIAMDGSGELDRSFGTALTRAASGNAIDSYSQLRRATRKVEELDGQQQRIAKQVVASTDGDGVKFLSETSESDLKAVFGQVGSASGLGATDAVRYVRATDGDAARVVDEVPKGRYSTLLGLSAKSQRQTRDVLVNGKINGEARFVDEISNGGEVVTLAKKFENGDYQGPEGTTIRFEDVRVLAEQPDGRTMFFAKQNIDHAFERHVLGEEIATKAVTGMYPTGNIIRKSGIDSPAKLPSRMSLSNRQIRNEIKDYAYRTARNENHNGGDVSYDGISRNGIEEITINVDGSKIESVYPSEGPAVRRWNGDASEWQKWDSNTNDWVEWKGYQP